MTQKQRKSIQQLLQSRISQRRNLLGELEAVVAKYKVSPHRFDRIHAKEVRQEIITIASHQRLDKSLFAMVLDTASYEREMQAFHDAVAAEAEKGLFGVNWGGFNMFGGHAHG